MHTYIQVTAKGIYDAIHEQGADHMCAAPIVLNFIVNAQKSEIKPFSHKVFIYIYICVCEREREREGEITCAQLQLYLISSLMRRNQK